MDSLRLGIIGTGSVVREIYHYLYFHSEYSRSVSVEAICDSNAGAREEFSRRWKVPSDRCFSGYEEMLTARAGGQFELDAVAVNTPDSMHAAPSIAALEAGLDVIVPKPTAERVEEVHRISETADRTGRFFGVDFHKREDPVVKEARARVAGGVYGSFQSATFHMLDRLMVADPNHEPRFFSSPDFAERNSPVTFLTSHMADAFMYITRLKPVEVRATGYRQKLPSLRPIAVNGYDLVDTTVVFEGGASCHIITGWALPNTADCLTVQSGRLVFSDGMLDLWDNHYGFRETTASRIENRNVSFRTFEEDGMVGGYGMDCPGKIIRNILRFRTGEIDVEELRALRSPFMTGFYTTLVCECATASLEAGRAYDNGAVVGAPVDAHDFLAQRIGTAAAKEYLPGH